MGCSINADTTAVACCPFHLRFAAFALMRFVAT